MVVASVTSGTSLSPKLTPGPQCPLEPSYESSHRGSFGWRFVSDTATQSAEGIGVGLKGVAGRDPIVHKRRCNS